MRISVSNIDAELLSELSKICTVVGIDENPKGVFLQWVTPEVGYLFTQQTYIIEKCVKHDIPMIIFDKEEKMSPEEVGFLMSKGSFLWEPAVTGRNFFSFQPVWGNIITKLEDIKWDFDVDRSIDLANTSPIVRKTHDFDKYYNTIHEIGGYNVLYVDHDGNRTISNKISSMNIPIINTNYNDGKYLGKIKYTVLIGSDLDYETGTLPTNLFELLENGVVPLLPREHRWYHSVFDGMLVDCESDIEHYIDVYDRISFGCVYEIYKNLDKYLPEANVKNVAKRIVNYLS